MRKFLVLTGLVLFALPGFAGPAGADFILFLHTFGEWTVICALDEPTRKKRCRISAPAPLLGSPASGARVRVDVVNGRGNAPQVEVRAQHVVDPARTLSLRIDDGPDYKVQLPRTGEVAWTGTTAAAIVAAMTTGETLAIRFFEPWADVPRERYFALAEFPEALAAFREVAHRIEGANR